LRVTQSCGRWPASWTPRATACALPKEALIEQAAKLLEIDVAIVREALDRLVLDGELVYEPIGGHDLIYLPYLRRAEDGIAGLLRKSASAPSCLPPIPPMVSAVPLSGMTPDL
jgi:hypothetical protein